MSSSPPHWIILPLMLLAGCGEDGTVTQKAPKAQSRELTLVGFDTLKCIHNTLGNRLKRIDTLARGLGLPEENTIDWSRRPPNVNDGRKLHSYVAQWSTHRMRFGQALQPDQRPGAKISVIAKVNSEEPKNICGLHLIADWRSEKLGWDATVDLFTFRPYQQDSIGEEKLRIYLEHTDGKTRVVWPFSAWGATLRNERRDPQQAGTMLAFASKGQKPSLRQICSLLASPESFLNEVRRELDAMERRALDDIAASRGIRLFRHVYTTSIPDPSRMKCEDCEVPEGFQLTEKEKQAFTEKLTVEIQNRRTLFEENHEDMYAAVIKAFPIDAYFAKEPNVASAADKSGNSDDNGTPIPQE